MKKQFKCPICGYKTDIRSNIKRHLKNVEKWSDERVKLAYPDHRKEPEQKTADQPIDYKVVAKEVLKVLPKRERLEVKSSSKSDLKPEVWLLEFSDLHYGAKVNPLEVGGIAEYNPEIAQQRVEELGKLIVRFLEYHSNRPSELVITFLGDMVDGSIMRGNQQASTEFGIVTQTMVVSELVTDFIIFLSGYFEKIRCYGVYGNHGRLTKSPMDSHPAENLDRLVYYIVKERVKGIKGVSFDYTEAQHMIVKVNGWKFWLEHGDTVRSWMGIPFYGGQREKARIDDMLATYREHADYVLVGHHHNPATFNGLYFNGAFIGGDLYSIGRLRRASIPSQKILGINENHGVVWERNPLLIDKPWNNKVRIYE